MDTNAQDNAKIWDRFYATGHRLWYPYEVCVRLVRYHLAHEGFAGLMLDHGCGSGNHMEFLTRVGVRLHGTEVSSTALQTVRSRFEGAMLPTPGLSLIDPDLPLQGQLPEYDHVIAWGSTHYNRRPKVLADIKCLIDGLPQGGAFIFQVPTVRDVAARQSEKLEDGSFRIIGSISSQTGATCTYPEDLDEFRSWFPGIDLRDTGSVAVTLFGTPVEYYFAYGVKN
ncbi:MAG: class I SAM-dependent methyltransferase [Rhizobiaceae bacterium]|nr:class I SAM-dependent methyltransferase [Rhizobiaceae bacterium]